MFNLSLFATKLKRISQTNNTLAGHCIKYYYISVFCFLSAASTFFRSTSLFLSISPSRIQGGGEIYRIRTKTDLIELLNIID